MKNIFISLILCVPFLQGYGQYTLCDCCTYETLFWTEDFEKWFPAESIKKDDLHELTIYSTSKQTSDLKNDSSLKIIDPEYREMILKFNDDGYVIERIFFSQLGQYSFTNEFIRNNHNQIVARTFFYLDSMGIKMEDFIPQKWIYDYDSGKLIKLKKLGDKFIEFPDSQSIYFSYKYDELQRKIEDVSYYYYEGSPPLFMQTNTTYNKQGNSSISKTSYEGKINSIEKTTYNTDKNPLKTVRFYRGKKVGTRIYVYGSNGRLIRLETTSISGYTECNDGGNSIETYRYSKSNLLTSIEHCYKNTICSLRFEFR